jgi:hypothetical protein
MAKPPNLGTIIAVAKKIIRWISRTPVRTLADDLPVNPTVIKPSPWLQPGWTPPPLYGPGFTPPVRPGWGGWGDFYRNKAKKINHI